MKNFILLVFSLAISITTSMAQSGITWGMGMNIANSSHDNLHPRIATDAAGNALVIWGRMSDESVLFSRWTGQPLPLLLHLILHG